MSTMIQCVSHVDGRVYAQRPALSPEAAAAAAGRAKAAQPGRDALSLDERITRVNAGVSALNAMTDPIVEELAWQMGRPTGFGGEFGGVNERTVNTASIAAEALAPMVAESSDMFERRIETGTVLLNRADDLDPAICWTGCKDTGRGGSLSVLGFHAVTRPQSHHLRKVKV